MSEVLLRVPVVDIGALMAATSDAEIQAALQDPHGPFHDTVSALRSAATEWGFFYITNHGVSVSELAAFQSAMRAFFALSKDVKSRVRRNATNSRGYFDDELTKNQTDWKEGFDFAGRHEDGPPDASSASTRLGDDENQWLPEDVLPGFKDTMTAYFGRMEHIARRLLMLFAVALGERVDFFAQFFVRTDASAAPDANSSFLRLNYYPVAPNPDATMGVYHHTDAGALTVLLQDDDVASLQVFHRGSQEWHLIPPRDNTFVINIGDMAQVWSNDQFAAPLHRVLANGVKARYSAPFFYNPSYSASVEPVVVGDANEKPKYRPLSWRRFRSQRFAGDYANVGEEIQISHFRIHEEH